MKTGGVVLDVVVVVVVVVMVLEALLGCCFCRRLRSCLNMSSRVPGSFGCCSQNSGFGIHLGSLNPQLCEDAFLFAQKISNPSIIFTCWYAYKNTKMGSKNMRSESYCFIMFDHILTSYSVMCVSYIYISESVQLYLNLFDKVNFKKDEICWESGLAGGNRSKWALACALRVGTKGNCGWLYSWPCEPCAYLPEVVHARRTSSMAVPFGKHSRRDRLRRVLRSPSMVESACGRPGFDFAVSFVPLPSRRLQLGISLPVVSALVVVSVVCCCCCPSMNACFFPCCCFLFLHAYFRACCFYYLLLLLLAVNG